VRAPVLPIVAACALACAVVTSATPAVRAAQPRAGATRITWEDAAPLRARLEKQGITQAAFASYVERLRENHTGRVREGDLDHLVFYLLQSRHFTPIPAIEPALSAKELVGSLDPAEREIFLRASRVASARIPPGVRSRVTALLRALDSRDPDARLTYFRSLAKALPTRTREDAILHEYARVMRFLYEKEFVAQRSANPAVAVAELYRTRGLSTDTAVEAGYVVYNGLGILKSLEPARTIRRVLIVGPGLDLAPRTGLLESGPPQSYQPWAVMDALLSLGVSRVEDLEIVAADINPRVVDHLRRARSDPPTLVLASAIRDSDTVTLSADYRDYFARLGRAIGANDGALALAAGDKGRMEKTVRVTGAAARALSAETVDIVTDRLDRGGFDLVVATNILPYFDDTQLVLAMTNIAGMLAPGGVLLHNEARPVLGELTDALGLPFEQSRQVVIASVRGAPPLSDSVWLHRKR